MKHWWLQTWSQNEWKMWSHMKKTITAQSRSDMDMGVGGVMNSSAMPQPLKWRVGVGNFWNWN